MKVGCYICGCWLADDLQAADHNIGKKHNKNVKRHMRGSHARESTHKSKGVEIPAGTALVLEQEALWNDAVQHYMLSLYTRHLLRSNL
jgi:hypothetical protein